MNTSISQQKQDLQAKIAEVTEKIASLEGKLRALDKLLDSISSQRQQYQLLGETCVSLEKLSVMGAADLFWEATGGDPEKELQRVRGVVAGFEQKVSAVEQSRSVLQADIKDELASVRLLSNQLAELQQKTERLKNENKSERQAREIPYRAVVMPWSRQGEDERLFRKALSIILFFAIVFGGLVPLLKQPVEMNKEIVVPERIAQLIKKKQEAKPVEQKPLEKTAEKKDEKMVEKTGEITPEKTAEKTAEKTPSIVTPKPIEPEVQILRKTAEAKGVLAFKNNFADLLKDSSSLKMGAAARISNHANQAASEAPQRSIIVSQATGGSGGINISTLNRQSEGSAGQRIHSDVIKFTRIETAASSKSSGADRLTSAEMQPSRTDEEIQIVFDRYKSALYRIYNRELRTNPALRGKMVLRIVIEPDGRVSECTVKSTDLASPALPADIVDRVLKFNFGTKEGVPAITILYPIDFLPAT